MTGTPSDLINGQERVPPRSDEPRRHPELTGNATAAYVYSGKTFYSTDPKVKLTGTMTISSILSFSAAVYSSTAITFSWKNPAKGPFSGVIVIGKTGSYPASITDGTQYYKGAGNNTSANGTSSATVSKFQVVSNITFQYLVTALAQQVNFVRLGYLQLRPKLQKEFKLLPLQAHLQCLPMYEA